MVHDRPDRLLVIGPEELKSFFLPEDFDYQMLNITGNQTNHKASFAVKDISKDNLVNWLTELEIINKVSLKIKTKKVPTAGYVVLN